MYCIAQKRTALHRLPHRQVLRIHRFCCMARGAIFSPMFPGQNTFVILHVIEHAMSFHMSSLQTPCALVQNQRHTGVHYEPYLTMYMSPLAKQLRKKIVMMDSSTDAPSSTMLLGYLLDFLRRHHVTSQSILGQPGVSREKQRASQVKAPGQSYSTFQLWKMVTPLGPIRYTFLPYLNYMA